MGCSTVGGYSVHGEFYALGSFGPANIPRDIFLKHKSVLEEIEISQEWLFKKTGRHFPCSFKPTELYMVDFDITIKIAELLGIEYIKSRKPTSIEKAALRRAIIQKIDAL
jgi:hypothetical protein